MFTDYKILNNDDFRYEIPQSDDKYQEAIELIKKAFSAILELNPEAEIPSNYAGAFEFLSKIIDSRTFNSKMYEIIPTILYPQLIAFFRLTNNPEVHLLFSRIFIALSYGDTESLIALLDNRILEAIKESFFKKELVFSFEYLFQIITNFLDDSNPDISSSSYQLFDADFLFQYFDFFTENLVSDLAAAVLFRWMKTVTAVSQLKNVTDDPKLHTSILNSFLEKVSKRQQIIDDRSADLLCDLLKYFIEQKFVDFSIFNRFCYPNLLLTFSYSENRELQSKALKLIAQLISINSFTAGIGYFEFLDSVLNLEDSCLDDKINVCIAFYDNISLKEKAFEGTTEYFDKIIEFAQEAPYNIKHQLVCLLSKHLEYMCINDPITRQTLFAEIGPMFQLFFDFIESAEDYQTVEFPMDGMLCFIEFLEKSGEIKNEQMLPFIQQYNLCIENLKNEHLSTEQSNKLETIQDLLQPYLPTE